MFNIINLCTGEVIVENVSPDDVAQQLFELSAIYVLNNLFVQAVPPEGVSSIDCFGIPGDWWLVDTEQFYIADEEDYTE